VLLIGSILAPGKRTVASALRATGLQDERHFCRYHRVLSRAVWSSAVAEDPQTDWRPIMVADWYGSTERTVEVLSETAVWHSTAHHMQKCYRVAGAKSEK
jgi:hypothetical protein